MTANHIRKAFLDFFKSKEHTIVPSAPMVIKNDPTLMFTNAGMNQFKDIFLGNTAPKSVRVANSQKCLRVSGKHNDLEDVGFDTYHHTMFEMLGNWSFGDYFKKEAIQWAWEFLVDVVKVNPEDLYITVFEGDKNDGLGADQEAIDLWKKIIPEERILLFDRKDNFWEMGDAGPCGPCSEIHIDLRTAEDKTKIPGKDLVNMDHPQVVEIWNLVFIQYNRAANGKLSALPAQHIDTGMGFERLAMALQGKLSNYDTDVFSPLISEVEAISGLKYVYGIEGSDTFSPINIAIRVIVDHIRAIAYSIADGQLPSNTGAGYVIRRILRRAVRYGYQSLNIKSPFLNELVGVLVRQLGDAFPELKAQQNLIQKVVLEEETSFYRTLELGIKRINQSIQKAENGMIDGEVAFELYDTYGFPIDLTRLMAKEQGLKVDDEGFNLELNKQKERSKKASKIEASDWVELKDYSETQFLGYDELSSEVEILRYRNVKVADKEVIQLVFNQTPFYPEGGGQVGDTGYIELEGEKITIENTKKENNLIVHFVKKMPSNPTGVFTANVSKTARKETCNNHSATHLLHQALRSILGTHVEQKGSLVNQKYLRFDFSHFSKLTEAEISEVEDFVNQKIRSNIKLQEHRDIAIEKAKSMGAMALFGEKYGDNVRAIQFDDSIELCGGTHVGSTSEIGFLRFYPKGLQQQGLEE